MLKPSTSHKCYFSRSFVVYHSRHVTSKQNSNSESRYTFEEFGVKNNLALADWYQIDPKRILDSQCRKILNKEFRGSLFYALSSVFSEVEWYPWKFKYQKTPAHYWSSISNQRKFFDELGKQIGVQKPEDWYDKISVKLIEEHGGSGLVQKYGKSAINALKTCYPEYNWLSWKFKVTNQRFWKSVKSQRDFFDWMSKELGLKHLDDWYNFQKLDVLKQGGHFLTTHYSGSLRRALQACYPDHNWIPWKFKVGHGYWTSPENHRQFFDWLGQELGVRELDDWYEKLNSTVMVQYGGASMVGFYGSTPKALMACYPEHKWYPWKFQMSLHKFWNSMEYVSQYVAMLSEKFCIQTLDDWYRVDWVSVIKIGASRLLKKYGGLYPILGRVYPNHPWDPKRFITRRKAQRWLKVLLQQMYPGEGKVITEILIDIETAIQEDYLHTIKYVGSGRPIQFDLYMPEHSIAFEYQGEQHYQDVSLFLPSAAYKHRDEEKKAVCQEKNIILIEVPYWWDRQRSSLASLIPESAKERLRRHVSYPKVLSSPVVG